MARPVRWDGPCCFSDRKLFFRPARIDNPFKFCRLGASTQPHSGVGGVVVCFDPTDTEIILQHLSGSLLRRGFFHTGSLSYWFYCAPKRGNYMQPKIEVKPCVFSDLINWPLDKIPTPANEGRLTGHGCRLFDPAARDPRSQKRDLGLPDMSIPSSSRWKTRSRIIAAAEEG